MASYRRSLIASVAFGSALVVAGGASVLAATGPLSTFTLTNAQVAASSTLTATMWESAVPELAFLNTTTQTSWSPQPGNSTAHRYRIAAADGSIVDRQPTEGTRLSEAQQSAVYAAKGFGGQWPYEFIWSVVLCQTAQDPYDLVTKPDLKSVQQWDLTKIADYPNPTSQSEYYDWQSGKLLNGSGWTSLAEPWNSDFQTQSGFGGQSQGSYTGEVSLSVYADFDCPGNAEPRVVRLLDAAGNAPTTRTINLTGARVLADITVPNVTVPIDLVGHTVMVTGYNTGPLNAATWGIAKVATSTVSQSTGDVSSQPAPSGRGAEPYSKLAEAGVGETTNLVIAGFAAVITGVAIIVVPLLRRARRIRNQ